MSENVKFQSGQPYKDGVFDFKALAESVKSTKTTPVMATKPKGAAQNGNEQTSYGNTSSFITDAIKTDYEIDIEEDEIEKAEELEEQYEKEVKSQKYKNKDLQEINDKLSEQGYMANASILYTLKNALLLDKPILIEGEPGVGKTSLAETFANAYGMELIKVQFYNGITSSDILYEYDYGKQMLYMNAIRKNINNELKGLPPNDALIKLSQNGVNFFGKDFLIERPLLKAISGNRRCVLLLDEIDKSEEDVEFMLLEILDKFSITIPEYGTVKCEKNAKPIVFLTSNRYRDLSNAMKRRCLYLYIEPKTIDETTEIIVKNSKVSPEFAFKVAKKVNEIRSLNLKQQPSISDSINWAFALFNSMGIDAFDDENIKETLGVLLKNRSDIELVRRSKMV